MEIDFRKIFRKGLNSLLIEGSTTVLALVFNWYLAVKLGADQFGYFVYAFSWMMFLGTISTLGINSLLQREIPVLWKKEKYNQVKGMIRFSRYSLFLITLTISLISIILIRYFLSIESRELQKALLLSFIALPFFTQLILNESTSVAFKQVEKSFIPLKIIRPLIALLIILIIFESYNENLLYAISVNVIAYIIAFFFSVYFLIRFTKSPGKASLNKKQWFQKGFHFFLLTVAVIINSKADVLMLGFFGLASESGIYVIAVKLSTFIAIPLLLSNSITAPYISSMIKDKPDAIANLIKKIVRIVFLIGLLLFIIYILAGEWALGLFGKDFTAAYAALLILGFSQLINVVVGPVGNILTMSRNEKTAMFAMFISTALNIILNIILIPLMGINGAAIATGISLIYWNLHLFVKVRNIFGFNPSAI